MLGAISLPLLLSGLIAQPTPTLARQVAEAASPGAPLGLDESLRRAARTHARQLLADEAAATYAHIEAALAKEGLFDAQILPFASVGGGGPERARALLDFAARRALGFGLTHLGVARATRGHHEALVALFARRLVDLPPLPKTIRGRTHALRGRASKAALGLAAYSTDPLGEVSTLAVAVEGRGFAVVLPLSSGPGTYTFEILATTKRGPEIAALFQIAQTAPSRPTAIEPLADRDALLATIERLRKRYRRGSLRAHPALASAAQRHAEAVCRAKLAVHVLPGGDTPRARARAAGYEGPVTENVALADSIGAAHANLLSSPSHRKNLLDAGVRRLGLGLVERGDSVCVVQLFGG